MPKHILKQTSLASVTIAFLLVVAFAVSAFFSVRTATSAQTGVLTVGNANQLIRVLNSTAANRLFQATPQLAGIRSNIILGPFDIATPVGLCEIQLSGLVRLGANAAVLNSTQIPNQLGLWRLLPNAPQVLAEAWVPVGYSYNPVSNSIIFQCFDAATYVLFKGESTLASLNAGLSDAGQINVLLDARSQALLVLAGAFLLMGGALGFAANRKETLS